MTLKVVYKFRIVIPGCRVQLFLCLPIHIPQKISMNLCTTHFGNVFKQCDMLLALGKAESRKIPGLYLMKVILLQFGRYTSRIAKFIAANIRVFPTLYQIH